MSTLASMIIRDTFTNRPAAGIAGRLFFADDTGVQYRDNGSSWDVWGSYYGSGATGLRPTVTIVGASWFDTTLGYMIWWSGAVWVNGAGATV